MKTKRFSRYIIMTLCLVICLSVVSITASKYITDLTISACFQRLRDSTNQYALDIRQEVEADGGLMETIAGYIGQGGSVDSEKTQEIFSWLNVGNMIDGIGMILPDGRVLAGDKVLSENLAGFPFEEEAAKGPHISERMGSRSNPEQFYIYHFVPVLINEKTEGILFGRIDLEKLGQEYTENLEANGTTIHLIEGRSGAFLIDTAHQKLENAESFLNREIKKGYSFDKVLEDITGGKKGETAFFSTTIHEYFYCVYEPVGINDWMVMMGQPENAAFREARNIRLAMRSLAIFETAAFLIYLFIVFLGVKKASKDKVRELDRVQYIVKIEEILFDAARNPGRIEEALQEIGKKLSSEFAFFIIYDKDGTETMYIWREHNYGIREDFNKRDFPVLYSRILPDGCTIFDDINALAEMDNAEYQKLKSLGIKSLMVIPVNEPNHTHVGSLGVANMRDVNQTSELLECVMLSFSMVIKNIKSFQAIEEMGIRDNLTGLRNRTSFEQSIAAYEKEGDYSLACIYLDADGLHEINNYYGHEAGDQLLKSVAGVLAEEFGDENAFRIGGDEFAAFCRGMDKKQVEEKIRNAKKRVERDGYHISAGMEYRENTPFVYEMIKAAEKSMFEAKKNYHEAVGEMRQIRGMDRRLEGILMEKRNLDMFRDVLASKYLGVYIVNMAIDSFHFIYNPSYFSTAAEQAGGKFSEAMKIYVKSYVCGKYHDSLIELLDYSNLKELLNKGEEPEVLYIRQDGVNVLLKIYGSPYNGAGCRECIWTFEKMKQT